MYFLYTFEFDYRKKSFSFQKSKVNEKWQYISRLINDKSKISSHKSILGYAFFMESSSIEYIMERDCDLTKVGGELDSKSYGIGMRKRFVICQFLLHMHI